MDFSFVFFRLARDFGTSGLAVEVLKVLTLAFRLQVTCCSSLHSLDCFADYNTLREWVVLWEKRPIQGITELVHAFLGVVQTVRKNIKTVNIKR